MPTPPHSTKVIQSDSKLLNYFTRTVVILVALGAAILSFDALTALAIAAGIRTEFAWMWAIVIDGFIMVATFAAFALRERGASKYYAWITLAVFVLLSILGNAWHAVIEQVDYVLPITIAVLVTAIPPLALFLAIHLLVIMVSPTSEQKKEHKKKVEQWDRLQKIKEKEIEKIEQLTTINQVWENAGHQKPSPTPQTPPTPPPTPQTPPTPQKTTNQQPSPKTPTTPTHTREEVRSILAERHLNGEPFPTGAEVAQWMNIAKSSGQRFVKKFKDENSIP